MIKRHLAIIAGLVILALGTGANAATAAPTPAEPAKTVAGADLGIQSCAWGSSNSYIWVKSCSLTVYAKVMRWQLGPVNNCRVGFFRMWNEYDYGQRRDGPTAIWCIGNQANLGPAFSNRSCATFFEKLSNGTWRENGSGVCNQD